MIQDNGIAAICSSSISLPPSIAAVSAKGGLGLPLKV
jgi:hypothetical protein